MSPPIYRRRWFFEVVCVALVLGGFWLFKNGYLPQIGGSPLVGKGVLWAFSEPPIETYPEFEQAVIAFNQTSPEPVDVSSLNRSIGKRKIAVRFIHSVRNEGSGETEDAWEDAERTVELESIGAELTLGEVLFQLHQQVGSLLTEQDPKVFEGLERAGKTENLVPRYDLYLGG